MTLSGLLNVQLMRQCPNSQRYICRYSRHAALVSRAREWIEMGGPRSTEDTDFWRARNRSFGPDSCATAIAIEGFLRPAL